MKKVCRMLMLLVVALTLFIGGPGRITAQAWSVEKITEQEQNQEKLTVETIRVFLAEAYQTLKPWYVGCCEYVDPETYDFQKPLIDSNGKMIPYPVKHETIQTREQLKELTEQYVSETLAEELLDRICATDVDGKLCVFPGLEVGGPEFHAAVLVSYKEGSTKNLNFEIIIKSVEASSESVSKNFNVVFEQGKLKLDDTLDQALNFLYLIADETKTIEIVDASCEDKTVDTEAVTIRYGNGYSSGIADLRWGPGLFAADAFTFNQPLAAVAGALCCASADQDEESKGTGSLIETAYEALGFEKTAIALYHYPKSELNHDNADSKETKDPLAFSIASGSMGDSDLILLVIGGSENEAQTDEGTENSAAEFYNEHPNERFLKWEQEVADALDRYIAEHSKDLREGKVKFVIAGYDVGGAVANLLAAELNNEPRLSAGKEQVYAYTFGAPNSIARAANKAEQYGNIFNFINFYDTLVQSANESTMYNRFGLMVPFTVDFRQILTKGIELYKNHSAAAYFEAVNAGLASAEAKEAGYYKVTLSGPVDVAVFSDEKELECRIQGNVVEEGNCFIPAVVGGENADEKCLLIPVDGEDYTISILGSEEGTADIRMEPFAAAYDEKAPGNETVGASVTKQSDWTIKLEKTGVVTWIKEPTQKTNPKRIGIFLFVVLVIVILVLVRAKTKRERNQR